MLEVTEIRTNSGLSKRFVFLLYPEMQRNIQNPGFVHLLKLSRTQTLSIFFLCYSLQVSFILMSQDDCCTSRCSICVLGRKKTEGLKVFFIQDYVLFKSHMAITSSKEAWQLENFTVWTLWKRMRKWKGFVWKGVRLNRVFAWHQVSYLLIQGSWYFTLWQGWLCGVERRESHTHLSRQEPGKMATSFSNIGKACERLGAKNCSKERRQKSINVW